MVDLDEGQPKDGLNPTSESELDRLEASARAATAGPWEWAPTDGRHFIPRWHVKTQVKDIENDATLICDQCWADQAPPTPEAQSSAEERARGIVGPAMQEVFQSVPLLGIKKSLGLIESGLVQTVASALREAEDRGWDAAVDACLGAIAREQSYREYRQDQDGSGVGACKEIASYVRLLRRPGSEGGGR